MVAPGDEIAESDALALLRARVTYRFNISNLADEFDVSVSFMSAVLQGKKRMTEPMLKAVGVERRTIYRMVK